METAELEIPISEQLYAVVHVYYWVIPGERQNWDNPGWPPEIDGIESYDIVKVFKPRWHIIPLEWIESRGFLPLVASAVEQRLYSGDYDDDLLDEWEYNK